MNNQTYRPFLLLLCVTILLCALRFVPSVTVMGTTMRQVDLLSDLFPRQDTAQEVSVSAEVIAKREEAKANSNACPEGMTCILDYGRGTDAGMATFYAALARGGEALGRPVRIAYFGDSFIEGDILTADLRALLQKRFGGCGVGYMDIASPLAGARSSVTQRFEGWDVRCVLERGTFQPQKLGISLRYAMPSTGAWTEVKAQKAFPCADRFERSELMLASTSPVTLRAECSDGRTERFTTRGDGALESVAVEGDFNKVRWVVEERGSQTVCYGVTAEGRSGISVDNFSLRGSKGSELEEVLQAYWQSLAHLRPYDMVVLQYGLNVAEPERTDYKAYVAKMQRVVEHLKAAFPHTTILIVGVGDRENKVNGELHTMRGVLALMQAQEELAAKCEVPYWNLYEAMGGDGSIVKMNSRKPEEARKDYTHITHAGGKRLAGLLTKTLLYGYEEYRKENERK